MPGRLRTRRDRSSLVDFVPTWPTSCWHQAPPTPPRHHAPSPSQETRARHGATPSQRPTKARRGSSIAALWPASSITSQQLPRRASANALQMGLAFDRTRPILTDRPGFAQAQRPLRPAISTHRTHTIQSRCAIQQHHRLAPRALSRARASSVLRPSTRHLHAGAA